MGVIMSLKEIYNKYKIKKSRIKCDKRILLICPKRDYDVSEFIDEFLIEDMIYEITFPKCKEDSDSYELLMLEVQKSNSELCVQIDCNFSKKLPYWSKEKMTSDLPERIEKVRGDVFINLHHHDEYSIRDSLGNVRDYVSMLKDRKQTVCAVTNHGSIGGWIKQYNVCKSNGIKPIFGMEAYVNEYRGDDPIERKKFRKNNHLCLWARNEEGFYNIIKIHNDAQVNGFYYSPRCDSEHLKEWGSGIIASSACYSGDIPMYVEEGNLEKAKERYEFYKSIFDDFYIELTMIEWEAQIEMNKKLIQFAQGVGAKLIVTLDSHYLKASHADTHDLLLLIRKGKTILDKIEDSEEVWQFAVRNLYCRDEKDVRNLWEREYKSEIFTEEILNEAIKNTRRITMSCDNIELDSTVRLPKLYPDANKELRDRALRGLKAKALDGVVGYNDRLNFELDVICNMGYADYFLVVERIVKDTKEKFGDLSVGWGRGCFTPEMRVIMDSGFPKFIDDVKKGDKVITDDGSIQEVEEVFEYDVDEEIVVIETHDGRVIECTKDHVIFINEGGKTIEKKAKDLKDGDDILEVI
jgi:DNA polymerase III alpha subunit (gram-positive type)/preprotein translocase subunit YajC